MIKLKLSYMEFSGFAIVEIVVAILAVAILVGGVYIWNLSDSEIVISSESQKVENNSDSNLDQDPYSSWNVFNSTKENLSFRYPAEWKLTYEQHVDPTGELIKLASPTGINIYFDSSISGMGGACDLTNIDCKVNIYDTVKLDNDEHEVDLYLVEFYSPRAKNTKILYQVGLVDEQHLPQDTQFAGQYHPIVSSINRDALISFSFSQVIEKSDDVGAETYFEKEDVMAAKEILKTLSYQK